MESQIRVFIYLSPIANFSIKLKIVMLHHMNNIFKNTAF